MYKKYRLDLRGGLPVDQNTLAFLQEAYSGAIDALTAFVGSDVIVTGCERVGASMTSGWIIAGGELIPYVGGIATDTFALQENQEALVFEDGQAKAVEYSRYAASGGTARWDSLVRIGTLKELAAGHDALKTAHEGLINSVNKNVITCYYDIDKANTGSLSMNTRDPENKGSGIPGDKVFGNDVLKNYIVVPVANSEYPYVTPRYRVENDGVTDFVDIYIAPSEKPEQITTRMYFLLVRKNYTSPLG